MKRASIIVGGAVVVIGIAAATAAASRGDEPDQGTPMPPKLRAEYLQALKDAGLEGQPGVSGGYVPGKGWELQQAPGASESKFLSYLVLNPDGTTEAR
jgi:hypothetical protein